MNDIIKDADSAQASWNEAQDRLSKFLGTFALADHMRTSRLTLEILDRARVIHRENPSLHPVSLVMAETERLLEEWFSSSLEMSGEPGGRIFMSGNMALLLSHAYESAPEAFLASSVPEDVKKSMRRTLLAAGPDVKISSMTPRNFDYGPMLGFARETWHRWNLREVLIAVLFWAGVYFVFYWWLSGIL